ncbi:MAG: hypothetical protein G01um101418_869 [Parcubacteria group bacterium Gr01-1014_18]|nr:MAG: hypothetical protein Greene041636_829 [Parcubacteria group bacterium Greene0416_36]TSC79870.1 MAG: hypothetical protein G01um101418_869 [Parcubacteria group bacterium Gr01-1014_18]TSC98302.1 MAG: hypothetical protein Greene101420_806 [Parcubacteria group bacterium Greene1014_20]TSD06657.1 MAG: hypothetical protein Greene07142_709 [Parcubacteria group bacterium Greene0714_2]
MIPETARKLLNLNARSYDTLASAFSSTRREPWPIMRSLADQYIREGISVLDLGCGNGRFFPLVHANKAQYTGIDQSQGLIGKAPVVYPEGTWRVGDVTSQLRMKNEELSKWGASGRGFDAIFSFAVLNHIPTFELQKQVLANAKSVLKPGGLLIMTNFNLWRLTLREKSVWKWILEKRKWSDADFYKKFGFAKNELGLSDVLTCWSSFAKATKDRPGGSKEAWLYYHAFTKNEIARLAKESGLELIDFYWENNAQRSWWGKGRNSVAVLR